MKKKIAELEADEKHMLKVLENLAQLLADPDAEVNTQQIDDWLGKIDFYVMPKRCSTRFSSYDCHFKHTDISRSYC